MFHLHRFTVRHITLSSIVLGKLWNMQRAKHEEDFCTAVFTSNNDKNEPVRKVDMRMQQKLSIVEVVPCRIFIMLNEYAHYFDSGDAMLWLNGACIPAKGNKSAVLHGINER